MTFSRLLNTSRFAAASMAIALLGACANTGQSVDTSVPEQGNPDFFKVRDSMADEVYVTDNIEKRSWFNGIRRIYIAPLNLEGMQVIQPHGAAGEERWDVDDVEQGVVQNTFVREMTRAMEADQAFHIVSSRQEAQAVLHSRVIAIHPYRTRVQAEAEGGGAVAVLSR